MEYSIQINPYWIDVFLEGKPYKRFFDWRSRPDGDGYVIKDEEETLFFRKNDTFFYQEKTYTLSNLDALSTLILDNWFRLEPITFQ